MGETGTIDRDYYLEVEIRILEFELSNGSSGRVMLNLMTRNGLFKNYRKSTLSKKSLKFCFHAVWWK